MNYNNMFGQTIYYPYLCIESGGRVENAKIDNWVIVSNRFY